MSKKLFTLFLLPLAIFSLFLIVPSPVQAQTQQWSGVCTSDGTPDGVATIQGLQCLLANVLSVAVTLIGLAGFIMVIVGAFQFLISGGNSKGIEDGKKTLTFAFSGLVVAVSAIIILTLIANFTGVQAILGFKIPGSEDRFGP